MNKPDGKPEITFEMREHANNVLHIVAQQLAVQEARTTHRKDYLAALSDILRIVHNTRVGMAQERNEAAERAAEFKDVAAEEWGKGKVSAELEAILGGLSSGSNANAEGEGKEPK